LDLFLIRPTLRDAGLTSRLTRVIVCFETDDAAGIRESRIPAPVVLRSWPRRHFACTTVIAPPLGRKAEHNKRVFRELRLQLHRAVYLVHPWVRPRQFFSSNAITCWRIASVSDATGIFHPCLHMGKVFGCVTFLAEIAATVRNDELGLCRR